MLSILKVRIDFSFGESSAGFCKSVWLPGSTLNFRTGSVSSMGGLIAATLFATTVSDSQKTWERAKGAEKGVVLRNGCRKECFGESISSLPPSGFQDLLGVLRANLKGAEKKRTLQSTLFDNRFSTRRLLRSFGAL